MDQGFLVFLGTWDSTKKMSSYVTLDFGCEAPKNDVFQNGRRRKWVKLEILNLKLYSQIKGPKMLVLAWEIHIKHWFWLLMSSWALNSRWRPFQVWFLDLKGFIEV